MRTKKHKFVIACYFIMLGLLIWGYVVFVGIYLRDGKCRLVCINNYGEALLELFVIPVLIVCCAVGFYYLVKY